MNKKLLPVFIPAAFFIAGKLSAQTYNAYDLAFRALTADRVSAVQFNNEQFNVNYDIRNPGSRTFEGSLSAGGEWRIITMSYDNTPNSISFTVR